MTKKKFKKIVAGVKTHGHFAAIIAVFSVVSLYAILSFWNSTNNYIDYLYSSTLFIDGIPVGESSHEVVPVGTFTDVMSDHVNAEAIGALYYEGIIGGYDDGSFRPDNNINRAEFLVIVSSVVDADFGGMVLGNCCEDVAEEWYSAFVCYAKQDGWIKGYSDGSCGPERAITRAEALKIAFEALDYEPCLVLEVAPYDDVALDAWYARYACSARIGGILSKAGMFNAEQELTRGELAQIIYNLMLAKGML